MMSRTSNTDMCLSAEPEEDEGEGLEEDELGQEIDSDLPELVV